MLTALVLGDGAGLSREDWQVLQDTGTVHLLVISGQHVGLLAGTGLSVDRRACPLWLVARPSAMVALGLRPGFCGRPWLWAAGWLRSAGSPSLSDDRPGAAVAPALSSPGCLVAAVAGTQWRLADGPVGESAAGLLAVLRGGGGVDLHLRWSLGALAMVANLDPCPVADRNRPWPVLAGPGIADQPQRAAGQSAGGALDQPGGAAPGIARDPVIAGALHRRVVTVAGGRFDRLAVHRRWHWSPARCPRGCPRPSRCGSGASALWVPFCCCCREACPCVR